MKNRRSLMPGLPKWVLLTAFCCLTLPGLLTSCRTAKTAATADGTGVLDTKTRQLRELYMDAVREKTLENYGKAITLFQQCLNIDPRNAAAMYELAEIYHAQGKVGDAVGFSKKAVELDPDHTWYLFQYGQLLEQTQSFKEAASVYRKLAGLVPDNPGFLESLARVYLMSGKADDAIGVYEQINRKFGEDESVLMQIHQIYLLQGKTDKAIEVIEQLTRKYPGDTRYLSILADACLEAGLMDKAFEVYQKILASDPDDPYVHLALAEYYSKKGDPQRSFLEMQQGFANSGLDVDTKIQILVGYFGISEVIGEMKDQAYRLIDILIEQHPGDPKVFSIQGDFLYRDQKLDEAAEAFRKVISIDSSRYVIWEQLLRIESEQEDIESLATTSQRAMDLFPEQPVPFLFRGMALYQRKEYSQAIGPLKSGAMLVVDNDELEQTFYSMLGDTYNQLSDHQKSDEAYERSLRIRPDNPYVLNNYSYYLSLRGEKLDKAESMARKANELSPGNPSYLDTYAWALYRNGKLNEAREWIGKAIDQGGQDNPVILEHAGDIAFKSGDLPKALDYWEKALKAGKGSDLLEKKLNDKTLYE